MNKRGACKIFKHFVQEHLESMNQDCLDNICTIYTDYQYQRAYRRMKLSWVLRFATIDIVEKLCINDHRI